MPAIVQSASTAALVGSTLLVLALDGHVFTIFSVHIAIGAVARLEPVATLVSHIAIGCLFDALARSRWPLHQEVAPVLRSRIFSMDCLLQCGRLHLVRLRCTLRWASIRRDRLVAMTFILGSSLAMAFTPALFAAAGTPKHAETTRRLMRLLVPMGAVVALAFCFLRRGFIPHHGRGLR